MKLFFFWYNGNRQDNYIYPDQQYLFNKSTIMLSLSMCALLILSIGFSFQSPVFAQISSTSVNNNIVKNNNGNNFAASFQQVVVSNVGQPPIITNISSKGIYKVQLSWNTPISIQSLPKSGFAPAISFMNASAPPATLKTIPNRAAASGGTTMGSGTQYNVPGSIQPLVSVNSFDMTIYDNHGKLLWNKVDQPVTGGKGFEQVVFPNGFAGDITILIHNIKSSLQKVTDSVEFSAKVG
ncbi:MAG: hypothetical protein WA667_23240 [Candidatus Nitrosopolaris sp.]